ncbi:helix-turn-helix domain-containing protein [Roseixanthobacter psychrophilus]|uniref:helix-turn-helix domain-containing protein n=1 Tax=Roseixanthobacter psychrophilus TaxID=3119917 RepID=UPI003D1A65E0
MVAICPCCRQAVPDTGLLVSLEVNEATRFGATIKLLPQEAKLLHELSAAAPGPSKYDDLYYSLYGYCHGPEDPKAVVKVVMSRLRKKSAPLNVRISAVKSCGYRLEIL